MRKSRRNRRATMGASGIGLAAAGIGLAAGAMLLRRYRPKYDLQNQVVLITGGSRGLGLAMAREFAAQGARIAICARDRQELERARQDLENRGAAVLAVSCDVSSNDDVNRMVRQVLEHYGRIDVLVNNAGVISVAPVEAQSLPDYQEALDVMFWGMVYPTLAVLPHMRARRSGHIANITSIGGKVSVPHLLSYNCAKFAAVGFSEGLHAELAKDGIRVTTVVPGLMRTGSFVNAYFKGNRRAEYSWFSVSSSVPLLAKSAQRAARQIVRAIRCEQAEVIITPQAKLLALANGIAPGLTAEILGVVNRLLPKAGPDGERQLGRDSESFVSRSPLTRWGRRAGHDLHQTDKPSTVPAADSVA